MTDRLPPNLLQLFAPRPALRYLPPADHAPGERRTKRVDGVAGFVAALQEKQEDDKDKPTTESWLERKDREALEKKEKHAKLMTEGFERDFNPRQDPNIRGDAYKTLFVSRLPYNISVQDLEREFARYGRIERVRIVTDRGEGKKAGKPKGYAFILFDDEADMKAAYKDSEYLQIRGRKVVVDVERGRTVTGWRPRRFGGGQGGRHYTKAAAKSLGFGPPAGPGSLRGGFRGGFDRGGGFRGGRGGFRGNGYGGGRGGLGWQGGAPDGAPMGPRSGGRGGYGGGGGGSGYDDRSRGNANFEPLPPRGSGGSGGGGYRDRDRDANDRYDRRDRDSGYSSGQKRPHEGGGYDDSRSRRRY